ncbi:class A beta-lactamase-related serine hydrolase [Mycobacterium asiaticum]|uniref:class A beta-lactamase-related serine hydrolase n=1 Tax=Mycobacterium asiaticum TaxID=1790 RepID=UPI000AE7E86A|nr:class A beta-lactamase-related serine hydrolase [Mycobacterium asiaticum]
MSIEVTASFKELAATIPARVGVALANGTSVRSFGGWPTGVAWSTIKVPLAIAALRDFPSAAEPLVTRAITESDNPASERLWSLLGEPAQAARRVQAVLAECGDSGTVVESRRLRPPYTAFGQTQWSLERQARFAAGLDDAFMLDLMRSLVPRQRWGLAAEGVAAKGGWGPGVENGYLVRQFGVIAPGQIGAALAADAATFEDGVAALSRLTEWLLGRLGDLTEQ